MWAGRWLVEAVYPAKCGLCSRIGEPPICADCFAEFVTLESPPSLAAPHSPIDRVETLYEYSGRAAQAVRRLKFDRVTSLAVPLARQLAEAADERGFLTVDRIVPVPIHPLRRFERGFNQSELLCAEMPADMCDFSGLRRVRRTRPQVGLTIRERLENLEGAFAADPRLAGTRVLLVDDVCTSGGTVLACAEALRRTGVREVHVLTLTAHRPATRPDELPDL